NTSAITVGSTNVVYSLLQDSPTHYQSAINARAGASTSLFNGGAVSINTTTTVNISAGNALFMDYTDPLNPVATQSAFGPFNNVTITAIAPQPVTYLGLNSSLSVVQQPGPFTPTQRRSIVPLGIAVHTNNTSINVVNQTAAPNRSTLNQLQDLIDAVGGLN